MANVPIKTNDLVKYNGDTYVVRSVKMTNAGPVLGISPVSKSDILVHSSEVSLADTAEKVYRAKSVGSVQIESEKSSHLNASTRYNRRQG